MKKTLALLFCCISLVASSQSEADTLYQQLLFEMLEKSGGQKSFKTIVNHMFDSFTEIEQDNGLDEPYLEVLREKFLKTSIEDMVAMMTPIYKKHFSLSDIEELIEFYDSPVGKKFVEKSPLIIQESMIVGQEWGEKIAKEFMEELESTKI